MNPRFAQRLSSTVLSCAGNGLIYLNACLTAYVRARGRGNTPPASVPRSARTVCLSVLLLLAATAAIAAAGAGVKPVSYDQMAASGQEPRVTRTTLNPAAGWVNSKVFVAAGDLVNITADGLVDPGVRLRRGPDGEGHDVLKEMTRECNYMSLVARIGDGQVFCVGGNATFEIVEGGQLSFHVNELDALRFDDLGSFGIEVRVITPAPATAKARPLVAVLPLVPVNLTAADTQAINLAVRGRLARSGRYTVIDPGQVDRALTGIALSDLASAATARAVGRSAGADQVVFGQVGRIADNRYTLTLQRVTVAGGKVEKTVVETIDCPPDKLADRVAALAEGV